MFNGHCPQKGKGRLEEKGDDNRIPYVPGFKHGDRKHKIQNAQPDCIEGANPYPSNTAGNTEQNAPEKDEENPGFQADWFYRNIIPDVCKNTLAMISTPLTKIPSAVENTV